MGVGGTVPSREVRAPVQQGAFESDFLPRVWFTQQVSSLCWLSCLGGFCLPSTSHCPFKGPETSGIVYGFWRLIVSSRGSQSQQEHSGQFLSKASPVGAEFSGMNFRLLLCFPGFPPFLRSVPSSPRSCLPFTVHFQPPSRMATPQDPQFMSRDSSPLDMSLATFSKFDKYFISVPLL